MGLSKTFTCSELGIGLGLGAGQEKGHKDYLSVKVQPLGQQPGTEASIAPGELQVAQHLESPDGKGRANNLIREKGVLLKERQLMSFPLISTVEYSLGCYQYI